MIETNTSNVFGIALNEEITSDEEIKKILTIATGDLAKLNKL